MHSAVLGKSSDQIGGGQERKEKRLCGVAYSDSQLSFLGTGFAVASEGLQGGQERPRRSDLLL